MSRNMFWFDRALRTIVGFAMLGLACFGSQPILYALGGLLLATGASGFCPLHLLFGVNDAPRLAAAPNTREPRRHAAA